MEIPECSLTCPLQKGPAEDKVCPGHPLVALGCVVIPWGRLRAPGGEGLSDAAGASVPAQLSQAVLGLECVTVARSRSDEPSRMRSRAWTRGTSTQPRAAPAEERKAASARICRPRPGGGQGRGAATSLGEAGLRRLR